MATSEQTRTQKRQFKHNGEPLLVAKKHLSIHLLVGLCRSRQPDLGHPLLLGGGVGSLDQQRDCRDGGVLSARGSVNSSAGVYPEVGRVAALQPHQSTSAAVDKLHCKTQETSKFKKYIKISPTGSKNLEKKKIYIHGDEYAGRQTYRGTDRQKVHKGFLILLLAHTLFTSSCAPKVLLKTGAVEERVGRERKLLEKKEKNKSVPP